jgi:hypothetical protein
MMIKLIKEHGLMDSIFSDLTRYCEKANEYFLSQGISKNVS